MQSPIITSLLCQGGAFHERTLAMSWARRGAKRRARRCFLEAATRGDLDLAIRKRANAGGGGVAGGGNGGWWARAGFVVILLLGFALSAAAQRGGVAARQKRQKRHGNAAGGSGGGPKSPRGRAGGRRTTGRLLGTWAPLYPMICVCVCVRVCVCISKLASFSNSPVTFIAQT